MPRKFEDVPAVRKAVPVLLGLFGPSGSGKTYTADRLATGMERVTGKPTFFIDTEANRALHYADLFKFRHVPFLAPFGPLDYLAAIEHCAKQGAGQIIVDSGSHVWEGQGGVLEMHEAELDRLAGNDYAKRERIKMLAWVKPKAELRRLINTLLQINCNFIFCFRAKEKLKLVKGKEPVPLGYQPIVSDEFTYEMTMNLFLPPASNGVPALVPEEIGERAMVKVPVQFREMLKAGAVLDENLGEALAKWARGDVASPTGKPAQAPPPADPESAIRAAELRKEILAALKPLNGQERAKDELQSAFGSRVWKEIAALPPEQLAIGLAALRKNIDGLAALKNGRQPGDEEA
jgi:hypothetical protein